mmetsp:Transcript_95235/g.308400  ORF Transcript_95235/g.308400 Transcript_95235/m.308400 type:complete len:289 (+) Transcript_95235:568-1434(+)
MEQGVQNQVSEPHVVGGGCRPCPRHLGCLVHGPGLGPALGRLRPGHLRLGGACAGGAGDGDLVRRGRQCCQRNAVRAAGEVGRGLVSNLGFGPKRKLEERRFREHMRVFLHPQLPGCARVALLPSVFAAAGLVDRLARIPGHHAHRCDSERLGQQASGPSCRHRVFAPAREPPGGLALVDGRADMGGGALRAISRMAGGLLHVELYLGLVRLDGHLRPILARASCCQFGNAEWHHAGVSIHCVCHHLRPCGIAYPRVVPGRCLDHFHAQRAGQLSVRPMRAMREHGEP